jgi:L-rhamnose mutarotase
VALQLLQYHGTDFAADMAKMAADPATKRLWALMKPMQKPVAKRELSDETM